MTRAALQTTVFASLVAFAALPGLGCAAMINGSHQEVKVTPYPGETHVNITGTDGAVVYDGKGPAEVSLRRNQDYKIKITKPGYQTETVQVTSSNVWWWLFPMLTFTGPFELISVFNGSIYAFNEDGIEVTLFRDGQKPPGAVSYDP